MRKQGFAAQIIYIIVAVFFVLNGIPVFLNGQYLFAIVWFLLTGLVLVSSVRQLFQSIQRYRNERAAFEAEDDEFYASENSDFDEKQRLRKLADLYESHLITKAEYKQKRKEILDHL